MSLADTGGEGTSTGEPRAYTRNATGLVREVSLLDHFVFNTTSTSPLLAGFISIFFVVAVFPRGNLYVALLVGGLLSLVVWACFALLTATMPKIGGDYVFNSRTLHPALGFAFNLLVIGVEPLTTGFIAGLTAVLGLNASLSAIGVVTDSPTFVRWGADFGPNHHNAIFITGTISILLVAILSALRTKFLFRMITIMIGLFTVVCVAAILIMAFTSKAEFANTFNNFGGSNTYQDVVKAGKGQGLYPSEGGYSAKETLGMLYFGIGILIYIFWGTYVASEVRRAGQRRRMLLTFVGAGIMQTSVMLLTLAVFYHAVGQEFAISAVAGNQSVGLASFPFYASLVAGNQVVVILLSIGFMLWFIPGVAINFAVLQRGIFTYAFEGLLPRRVAAVNENSHVPLLAIGLATILAIAGCAAYAYTSSYVTILTICGLFPYWTLFVVGVSATVIAKRRPDIYRGSPADWRVGGLPVLPIVGVGTSLVTALAIFLAFYFHSQTGLVHLYWTGFGPLLIIALGVTWWYIARSVRRSQGVDLDLLYRTLPPD